MLICDTIRCRTQIEAQEDQKNISYRMSKRNFCWIEVDKMILKYDLEQSDEFYSFVRLD